MPGPVAVALNWAVPPRLTVRFCGWPVMVGSGAAVTVKVPSTSVNA